MTPVGHTCTGLALGAVAAIPLSSRRQRIAVLSIFAVLANAPDLPLPNWGHDAYWLSHSLFVTIGLLTAIAFSVLPILKKRIGRALSRRFLLFGSFTWLSHLLLDTFYGHGLGLKMFWPVSDTALALPIPWFDTLEVSLPKLSSQSVRVMSIELLCYGPLLFMTLVFVRRISTGANSSTRC